MDRFAIPKEYSRLEPVLAWVLTGLVLLAAYYALVVPLVDHYEMKDRRVEKLLKQRGEYFEYLKRAEKLESTLKSFEQVQKSSSPWFHEVESGIQASALFQTKIRQAIARSSCSLASMQPTESKEVDFDLFELPIKTRWSCNILDLQKMFTVLQSSQPVVNIRQISLSAQTKRKSAQIVQIDAELVGYYIMAGER